MGAKTIQKLIDRAVGTEGTLRIPSWWMHKILSDLVQYCDSLESSDAGIKEYLESQLNLVGDAFEALDARVSEVESHELFAIVSELPSEPKANTIYLVPSANGEGNNILTEWVYVNGTWEQFGEFKADVDLSEYVKKAENPFEKGSAENSAVLKGGDNQANQKAYLITNIIDKTIYLESTEGFAVGDIVSIIVTNNYNNFAKITTIAETNITVDNIPSDLPQLSDSDYLFCLDKPNVGNIQLATYSTVIGYHNKAQAVCAYSEGFGNKSYGKYAHTEGKDNGAGYSAHAEGWSTSAKGDCSHSEGKNTVAIEKYSHAEGQNSIASGNTSHAEGFNTKANGAVTHSEGYNTTADGDYSHSEGRETIALAQCSHAEGKKNQATGNSSHAEGYETIAKGKYSHAEGYGTKTSNEGEHASGKFNASTQSSLVNKATQFSIGVGTSDTDRKNAFEVKQNGDIYVTGIGGYDGTNPTESNDLATVLNKTDTKLTELLAEVSELSNDVIGKSATLEKYDSSALTKGNYYDGTKATIEEAYSSASSWYSHLFSVKKGQTIHVVSDGNGKGIPAAILYAGSKMYELKFSNAYGQVDEIADFVVPQGVTHIAVNCYSGNIGSFELSIYTPSETGLNEVLDCFEKGKNMIDPTAIVKGKYLKPSNGLPTAYDTASISGFIPVIEGQTYIISGASRQSTGVAGYADRFFENPVKLTERTDYYINSNTPFVIPTGVHYIVMTLSYSSLDDIYNIMLNEGDVALPLDKYGLFLSEAQIEDIQGRISIGSASSESPFANKKIAFFGDSSTALPDSKYYPHSWVKVCCDIINPQSYKLYARSGSTLRTRYDENGTMQKCLLMQIQQMESEGYNPDIIMIQMGGNDISYMTESLIGTLADAKKLNYLQCKDILTMYGSIGYCIGYLKNKYPNALIVMGTVFQRTKTGIGSACEQVADIEKECAALFSLPVIDGFSESGISSQDECETATNFKCWDGMDEGQSAPDFGHPIFNYVNPTTGAILTKTDGEADAAAIKVYGRYTWDGTHQKESGINKVGHYMAARLSAIVE